MSSTGCNLLCSIKMDCGRCRKMCFLSLRLMHSFSFIIACKVWRCFLWSQAKLPCGMKSYFVFAHCLIYWYLQHWHWNEVLRCIVLQMLLQYNIHRVWYQVFAVCICAQVGKFRIALMLFADDDILLDLSACDRHKHWTVLNKSRIQVL